jgi:hypothetical protein
LESASRQRSRSWTKKNHAAKSLRRASDAKLRRCSIRLLRVGARVVALLSEPLSFSTVQSPMVTPTRRRSARSRSEIGLGSPPTTALFGSEALHEQALVRALGCGRDGRLR